MSCKDEGEEMITCSADLLSLTLHAKRKSSDGTGDKSTDDADSTNPTKNHRLKKNSDGGKSEYLAHLGSDLIAHISTFASIGNSGVMNICLAVGPLPSNVIRQAYLKNNAHYLESALRCLLEKPKSIASTNKCRDDYRAWMAVNSDWKRLCTKEKMTCDQRKAEISVSGAGSLEVNGIYTLTSEISDGLPVYRMQGTWQGSACTYCLYRCRLHHTKKRWFLSIVPVNMSLETGEVLDLYSAKSDDGPLDSPFGRRWVRRSNDEKVGTSPTVRGFGSIHPYAPFNSPAIAIELGLNEILKFYIKQRNIDINARFPFLFGIEPCHLLAVAMAADNAEAFRFLSSQDEIDMMRTANASTSLYQYAWAAAKKNGYDDCFIRTLIEHQSFDANGLMPRDEYEDDLRPLEKCVYELEDFMEDSRLAPLIFALSVLLTLLERGADPDSAGDGVTAPSRIAFHFYKHEKHRSRTLPGNERHASSARSILWGKVMTLLRDPAGGLRRWKDLERDTRKFFFPNFTFHCAYSR